MFIIRDDDDDDDDVTDVDEGVDEVDDDEDDEELDVAPVEFILKYCCCFCSWLWFVGIRLWKFCEFIKFCVEDDEDDEPFIIFS